MKIIALYLPQFHEIPENNEWWGDGFTEWVNVKKAKPLFEGHYQPRTPLGENYYNLLNSEVQEWQCRIARDNGIYGFCFYHYWFDGHLLLEKPVENYLKNKKCDLPFCLCWANENWTNAWVSQEDSILISQTYGDEREWEKHFDYVFEFMQDSRYIKIDGKPLLVIYRPEIIPCLKEMLAFWNKKMQENGMPGITFVYQHVNSNGMKNEKKALFTYGIEYQPGYAFREYGSTFIKCLKSIKSRINVFAEKFFDISLNVNSLLRNEKNLHTFDYDRLWNQILRKKVDKKLLPCAFVDWDNSPRRGAKGTIVIGATPEKFERYFERLVIKAKTEYKKDIMFVFAWNEWAEGGILEPTEKYGFGYLSAIKEALNNTGEWPW